MLCAAAIPLREARETSNVLSISIQKRTATVAFRELGNTCGTVAGEPDSLIARRIVVFRPDRGYWQLVNWHLLKEIDSVAVDRVQSEPLSGQFPLTGNKTEKFSAVAPKSPAGKQLSCWIYDGYGSLVRSGLVRNRELLIRYQGMIIP
jgi:hypothetical protein